MRKAKIEPKRRPVAYLQACHNLAWLALDDLGGHAGGPSTIGAARVAALQAVSALGDHGFEGSSPEE